MSDNQASPSLPAESPGLVAELQALADDAGMSAACAGTSRGKQLHDYWLKVRRLSLLAVARLAAKSPSPPAGEAQRERRPGENDFEYWIRETFHVYDGHFKIEPIHHKHSLNREQLDQLIGHLQTCAEWCPTLDERLRKSP